MLGATAVFCGGVVILNISLGLLLAVLLNRRFRGATFFRTLLFSPVVVSVVAWTLVWGFLPRTTTASTPCSTRSASTDRTGSSTATPRCARIRFPGSNALFLVVLAGLLVPGEVTIMPLFQVFKRAGMINTHWPLVLVTALAGPCVLATFIMRQFFIALPAELEEAGRLDGLGRPAIWCLIFLPLARPALSAVAILTFLTSWNLYLEPTVTSPHRICSHCHRHSPGSPAPTEATCGTPNWRPPP